MLGIEQSLASNHRKQEKQVAAANHACAATNDAYQYQRNAPWLARAAEGFGRCGVGSIIRFHRRLLDDSDHHPTRHTAKPNTYPAAAARVSQRAVEAYLPAPDTSMT